MKRLITPIAILAIVALCACAPMWDSLTNYPPDFDHGPSCTEIAKMSIAHVRSVYGVDPVVAMGWMEDGGAAHAQVFFNKQWYGLKYGEIGIVENPFCRDEYRLLTVAQFEQMKSWPAAYVINGGHRKFSTPTPEATRISRSFPWTL